MDLSYSLPKHIAIVMDGNGRWAKLRNLSRLAGHKAGVDAVKKVVRYCAENNIHFLTLFAFSSENWQRPSEEVDFLMNLFLAALQQEINELDKLNIKIKFIGERTCFNESLQDCISESERLTSQNTGLTLIIAANYGGQWDIVQASKALLHKVVNKEIEIDDISVELFERYLALKDIPPPDLFIRTSGEQRLSNFLIWHLAYTELYFLQKFWPDFNEQDLERAIMSYVQRERRFGCTSEQLHTSSMETIAFD